MNTIMRRESVCRNLFGPVDHDQLRRDLSQKMTEIAEQDSRRWNFDFRTETPLSGRFQWEEVPAERAAAVYQEGVQAKGDLRCSHTQEEDRLSGSDQENRSSVSNTNKRPAEVTPVRRKRTLCKSITKPRSNTRITDFFPKRRRSTEGKSILNSLHTIASEATPCKTIR